jgi:hypothetical protein
MMDWARLDTLSIADLTAMGWRKWNDPNDADDVDWPHKGQTLVLIPSRFYDEIPDGFEVIDIFGRREVFRRGESDDDQRGGMLAFGVLR